MDNFSYVFGLPDHHHASLEFADVQVGTDNRLFVDPARIHLAALAGYSWAMEADALIQSFLILFMMQQLKEILKQSAT